MSLLESAIRKAMKSNAVEEILDKEDPQMNTNVIILEEYLKRYKPISSAVGGVIITSTADIMSELGDMADLKPDEVNAVMIRLGYRPGRNKSGSFGWMMQLNGQ